MHQTMLRTYEVAHGDVQDPAVPPALVEVGQHVLEGQLHQLKADGQHPEQRVVPDDQRLQCSSAVPLPQEELQQK